MNNTAKIAGVEITSRTTTCMERWSDGRCTIQFHGTTFLGREEVGKLGSWEAGMDVSLLEEVVAVGVGSRCGTRPLHAGGDQKCGGSGRSLQPKGPETERSDYQVLYHGNGFREGLRHQLPL